MTAQLDRPTKRVRRSPHFSVYLGPDEHEELKAAASDACMSCSEFLRAALLRALGRDDDPHSRSGA